MQTGIDTYGMGRCPFYLEPSIIIVITDGSRLSTTSGVQEELTLPMHSSPVPGSDLTKEPFRWDQRLFALVLRLTGTVPPETNGNGNNGNGSNSNGANSIVHDDSPIDGMCEVTGGCSYSVSSQRSLLLCLENVVQKIQGGVVIHFEKLPGCEPVISEEMINGNNSDASNGNSKKSLPPLTEGASAIDYILNDPKEKQSWISSRKLIYVQRSAQKGYSVGHWPIPESFWPDVNNPTIPARTAHPIVKFSCTDTVPMVLENLPFDKYELEPSALTKVILARKQPNAAWQCYVPNSHRSTDSVGYPFGYLKASTNMNCVNLFVLPYDYPVLLPLLDELIKVHHCKPTREWKAQFDGYLKNMPLYYCQPLKRALQRLGVPSTLVPDSMENVLHFSVMNHLKRVKNQAKAEFDKVVSSVGSYKIPPAESIRLTAPIGSKKITEIALVGNTDHPRIASLKPDLQEYTNFTLRLVKEKGGEIKAQPYRNPYDISRSELIDQIHRMRLNYLLPPSQIKYQDDDQAHSLPVSAMGNYQEYLKKMPSPLRELESAPVRQHMFGNPFKIDKKGVTMVDETDIDFVGSNGSSSPGTGSGGTGSPNRPIKRANSDSSLSTVRAKRRPGPLPKDFKLTRSNSITSSSNSTTQLCQGSPIVPSQQATTINLSTGTGSLQRPDTPPPLTSEIISPPTSPVIPHSSTLTPPPEPMEDSPSTTTTTGNHSAIATDHPVPPHTQQQQNPLLQSAIDQHNLAIHENGTLPLTPLPSPSPSPSSSSSSSLSSPSSVSSSPSSSPSPSLSSSPSPPPNINISNSNGNSHQVLTQQQQQHLPNGASSNYSQVTGNQLTRPSTPPLVTSSVTVSTLSSAAPIVSPVTPPPEPMDELPSPPSPSTSDRSSSPFAENGLPSPSPTSQVATARFHVSNSTDQASSPINSHNLSTLHKTLTNHLPNGKVNNTNNKLTNATIYMASSRSLTNEQYKLRKRLFDLVKRPGKDYRELVAQLIQIEAPMKEFMLSEVIAEAKRFKRKNLVTYLAQEVNIHEANDNINNLGGSVKLVDGKGNGSNKKITKQQLSSGLSNSNPNT